MKGSNKHQYQMVAVLNPKTEEKDKAFDKALSWLESHQAKVTNKDHVGMKELVYAIKDHDKGDFWIFDIESEETLKLKEFNLLLNREVNIIRYLILKK